MKKTLTKSQVMDYTQQAHVHSHTHSYTAFSVVPINRHRRLQKQSLVLLNSNPNQTPPNSYETSKILLHNSNNYKL